MLPCHLAELDAGVELHAGEDRLAMARAAAENHDVDGGCAMALKTTLAKGVLEGFCGDWLAWLLAAGLGHFKEAMSSTGNDVGETRADDDRP